MKEFHALTAKAMACPKCGGEGTPWDTTHSPTNHEVVVILDCIDNNSNCPGQFGTGFDCNRWYVTYRPVKASPRSPRWHRVR